MKSSEELKKIVRQKYAEIADHQNASCCGGDPGIPDVYNIMSDDYLGLEGYNADANLGLGCGLPTQFANIQKGDTVIDLGSGAGNDCFIARHETGDSGKVIGIDFTESMIRKARINAEKMGVNNVEFRQGDIEKMPVSNEVADVVVSNCVLNLVPDKEKVFSEIFRVLKPGGHFSISDIVLIGNLPDKLKMDAEMYAGCVAGAIQKDLYLQMIQKSGFLNMKIQKEKPIVIPENILESYLTAEEIENFTNGSIGIFSITLFAQKPGIKSLKNGADTIEIPNNGCGPKTTSGCC